MKGRIVMACSAALLMACSGQQPKPIDSDSAEISYAFGAQVGQMVKGAVAEQEIDIDLFAEALTTALAGGELRMSEAGIKEAAERQQQRMAQKQEAERAERLTRALAEGEAFRKAFREKPGVVELESGLLYQRLVRHDEGRTPRLEDTVVAHYEGKLADGTVFDSSIERGSPASFPLSQVIKGWQEALQLMREGEKWQLVIPPELAYGERGAGGQIGPNETLVFDVELIEIKSADDA
ncbi:FKBP-type peptidyl-prolyl cis-trans isomerase [Alcanivorax quisquiliarum]|uniref:Peptidyl-prolyl cis-trans isomerase n=1 Tax=Alcanivorax quisquiliarum TaxID=2933565 RepID=A0ABT0E980_9GAMM|nr:FKBP-type peptidyl-prolyl cis-trans isomerase [Alcanivorax quisquiliarum]MCK0538320.1 FKBP-type peptidyl-prolyl cis-trans isomerase [Alcanivorax quisquiliarum]